MNFPPSYFLQHNCYLLQYIFTYVHFEADVTLFEVRT